MWRALRCSWTASLQAWPNACRHRTRRDRSPPRPRPPGRFSTWHPPRDGVRLQYKTEPPAGVLPPVPREGSGQARRPTAPLETDLPPRELTHRHAGTLEPGARLPIAGDHQHLARRHCEHVAAQRCELGLRHFDELDAAGEQRFAKRHRHKRCVNEEQVAVDRADDRHEVEDVHLMSIDSPIDRHLFLVYAPLMPVPFREALLSRGIELVEVPEPEFATLGCNVLAVAPREVLMIAGNRETRARLERAGVTVREFAGREICLKGGGGPTCLTRPLTRDRGEHPGRRLGKECRSRWSPYH